VSLLSKQGEEAHVTSLRQRANCIGLPANFSVMRDFFGYMRQPADLSIATQVDRLGFKRININVIRVGSDQMTNADLLEIDSAVRDTRNMFATRQLAVGRVFHWTIPTAIANGAEHIGNDDEAVQLTDDWTVPNSALDVFFVLTYAGTTIGLSAVDGPCDKDKYKHMTGSVVAIEGSVNTTAFVLAHEIGHYLSLPHVNNSTRLMNPTVPNGGAISSGEGTKMRGHCFVKNAC
jgi:hypothetical protein